MANLEKRFPIGSMEKRFPIGSYVKLKPTVTASHLRQYSGIQPHEINRVFSYINARPGIVDGYGKWYGKYPGVYVNYNMLRQHSGYNDYFCISPDLLEVLPIAPIVLSEEERKSLRTTGRTLNGSLFHQSKYVPSAPKNIQLPPEPPAEPEPPAVKYVQPVAPVVPQGGRRLRQHRHRQTVRRVRKFKQMRKRRTICHG